MTAEAMIDDVCEGGDAADAACAVCNERADEADDAGDSGRVAALEDAGNLFFGVGSKCRRLAMQLMSDLPVMPGTPSVDQQYKAIEAGMRGASEALEPLIAD